MHPSSPHPPAPLVFQADGDGICRFASEELLALAGLTPDALVGQFWFQLIEPPDRQAAVEEWERRGQENRPFTLRCTIAGNGAGPLAAVVHAIPIRGVATLTDHWLGSISLLEAGDTAPMGESGGAHPPLRPDPAHELHLVRAELALTQRTLTDRIAELEEALKRESCSREELLANARAPLVAKIAELERARLAAPPAADDGSPAGTPAPTEREQLLAQELHDARAARDALLLSSREELERSAADHASALRELEQERAKLVTRIQTLETEHAGHDTAREKRLQESERARGEAEERLRKVEDRLTLASEEHARTLAARERMTAETRRELEEKLAELRAELDRAHETRAEAELSAERSAETARAATREFRETLRNHDALAETVTILRRDLAERDRQILPLERSQGELTARLALLERQLLQLTEELALAQHELERSGAGRSTATAAATSFIERLITELSHRLGHVLACLPRTEDESARLVEQASTDLMQSLNDLLEFWHLRSGNVVLRRRISSLASWCTQVGGVLEFRAAQYDLTCSLTINEDAPERIEADFERMNQLLRYMTDDLLDTAPAGGTLDLTITTLPDGSNSARLLIELACSAAREASTALDLSREIAGELAGQLGGDILEDRAEGGRRVIRLTLPVGTFMPARPAPPPQASRHRARREDTPRGSNRGEQSASRFDWRPRPGTPRPDRARERSRNAPPLPHHRRRSVNRRSRSAAPRTHRVRSGLPMPQPQQSSSGASLSSSSRNPFPLNQRLFASRCWSPMTAPLTSASCGRSSSRVGTRWLSLPKVVPPRSSP